MQAARDEDAMDVDSHPPVQRVHKRRAARRRDDRQLQQLARTILKQSCESFSVDDCRELYYTYAVLLQDTEVPCDITYDDKQVSLAFQALENFVARRAKQQWTIGLYFLRMAAVMDRLGKLIKDGRAAGKVKSKAGKDDRSIAIQIHHSAVSSLLSEDDVRTRRRMANRWFAYTQGSLLPLLFASDKTDQIMRDLYITLDTLKAVGRHIVRFCARRSFAIAKHLEEAAQKAAVSQCTIPQLGVAYSAFETAHLGGDGEVQGLRREADIMDRFMQVHI
ncbi:hypothetical protein GGR57DRAFT_505755 [Xylariaceae sp. FL1272]|nr:hypothetical protein GGR57DRAFT_505755 [Xylariaceae sp. FL1272]